MGNVFASLCRHAGNQPLGSTITNEAGGLGTLARLPQELRDMIYSYVLGDFMAPRSISLVGMTFGQGMAAQDLLKKRIDVALWNDLGPRHSQANLPSILTTSLGLCQEALVIALPSYTFIVANERAAQDLIHFLESIPSTHFECVKAIEFGDLDRFDYMPFWHLQLINRCPKLRSLTLSICPERLHAGTSSRPTIKLPSRMVDDCHLRELFSCKSLEKITLLALGNDYLWPTALAGRHNLAKHAFWALAAYLRSGWKDQGQKVEVNLEWRHKVA
tara:strand:- start:140 stop:961 length:822 start_codon:yes stop_codon:yes gene_type:complete